MLAKHKGVFVCLILLFVFSPVFPLYAEDHDLELWTWESLTLDLRLKDAWEGTSLWLESGNRFDQDIEYHFRNHQSIGLIFRLPYAENLTFRSAFRHVNNIDAEDENRYFFNLSYKKSSIFDSDFQAGWGFQLDVRDIEDDISYRFRPNLCLSHPIPVRINDEAVSLFLSNETNYDTAADHWNRNRFTTGLCFPISKHAKLTVAYRVESNRISREDWDDDNIILTGLDFRF